MLTAHVTEQINEVSRTTTTTQLITKSFGRWPQTRVKNWFYLDTSYHTVILGRFKLEMSFEFLAE